MLRKILSAFLFISIYSSYAQQAPIAIVSTNGTTRLTSTLDSAAILAQDNDIIYLPGGTFTGGVNFYKKVTIIGVGHNPDSTSATGRTNITGSIGFYLGAEGSILDGIYVSNDVYVTTDNKVYRCNANLIYSPWGINVNNLVVEKCIIRGGVQGNPNYNNMYNSIVKNSIINAGADFVSNVHTSIFENNILFFNSGAYGIETADQCTFKNCAFIGATTTSWTSGASNSFFLNNIFTTATLPPLTDVNNASGNHLNQSATSIFVATSGTTYSYLNDYLINSSSPAFAGGTGGTQIGIYGGSSPWVKGNIPPNPHIRTKNVDAATGTGGTLRVRFNVGVQ